MLLFMAKNADNQVVLLLKIWGIAKQLFIKYLNAIVKLVLSHQKNKLAAHHSLIHYLNKSLKLLFKKMVKIVSFVQKNLQLFGQLIQKNPFLHLLYVVPSKKLDLVLVFLIINLQ